LLRGACHRARVRATRWLAMTSYSFCATLPAVIARLDRAIQYSRDVNDKPRGRGILDTPHARGMTGECGAWPSCRRGQRRHKTPPLTLS
jgi:hypothetical protein